MALAGETPVIEARELRHTYGGKTEALRGVSFSIRKGEVFGLLGRNGAGKSTLIKVMTTLLRPSQGYLRVLGMDPAHEGRRIRERIGVVQQGESFDFTSVEGNLRIYGVLWGVPREEAERRSEALLQRFELAPLRKRRSFDLSGGQKRRVQVAREFMHDMDVLFLDEPTVGLDILMRRELLDSIRREVSRGLTVVFTTHNLEEADYLCDRVAVIEQGKVLVLDEVENLKRLYGGKKTVELTLGPGDPAPFFRRLAEGLPPSDTLTPQGNSALLLTEEPKRALALILEISRQTDVPLEWLNIRKNTLEDVFLHSIEPEVRPRGPAQPP
jgi:ABC-2 type transport system ATP-binding protein